jgi:NADPH-dependent curcumin reductase CurA
MNAVNRQWCVGARPVGKPKESDFLYRETNIPKPSEGEVLLQTIYSGIAPVMRMYMQGRSMTGEAPLDIGDVIHGRGVARVIESRHADYKVGDVVQGQLGWQTYKVSAMSPQEKFFKVVHHDVGYALSVRMLSMTGLTAYTSFFDQGQPKKNDVVLVSGAAGGVGHMVLQMAKIAGCDVVGIAGGQRKCEIVKSLGADNVIDYKSENVAKRIAELCPDGVDIYYDNVGGEILSAALDNLAYNARIVLCGSISEYARAEPFGLSNYTNLRRVNAVMHGYFVYNYLGRFEESNNQLMAWLRSGQIKPLLDIVEGFENMPEALIGVYDGTNVGMRCVRVSDD